LLFTCLYNIIYDVLQCLNASLFNDSVNKSHDDDDDDDGGNGSAKFMKGSASYHAF